MEVSKLKASHKLTSAVVSIFILVIIVYSIICSGIAFAINTDSSIYIIENDPTITKIVNKANTDAGRVFITYETRTGVVSFSMEEYKKIPASDRLSIMEETLNSVQEYNLPERIKLKLYNFLAEQDTVNTKVLKLMRDDASANVATASYLLRPFSGVVGIILGVISILIFAFLGIGTVLDIAFLVIPMFQSLIQTSFKHKPFFISTEAWEAMIEANRSADSGVWNSYLFIYLKHRIIVFVVMGIALLYLISGKIYDVIIQFMSAF